MHRTASDVKVPLPTTAATSSVLLDAPDPKIQTVWYVIKVLSCIFLMGVHNGGNFSTTLQACRHFNDSGVCKENCPPPTIYDPAMFQSKPNPDRKFSFGATCVKTCPCEKHFLKLQYSRKYTPQSTLSSNKYLTSIDYLFYLFIIKIQQPLIKLGNITVSTFMTLQANKSFLSSHFYIST